MLSTHASAQRLELQGQESQKIAIHLAASLASGPNKLAAFDAALLEAGVANYNLIRLSSVIPPMSVLEQHDGPVPGELMPGRWGDRLYVVMAEKRIDTPNEEAWAGVGWVQDQATGRGLFVEHEGNSESRVRRDIEQSLDALATNRGLDLGVAKMRVIGGTCIDHPICALVVAAYQVSDWTNTAHVISAETARLM